MGLEWYWWVLIGVGVVAIGILKGTVFKKWMEKRQTKDEEE